MDRRGLELACAEAIAADNPFYRTIKGVLVARLEVAPPPPSTDDG